MGTENKTPEAKKKKKEEGGHSGRMKLKYLNKTLSITFEDKNVFFRGPKRASKKKKRKKRKIKVTLLFQWKLG